MTKFDEIYKGIVMDIVDNGQMQKVYKRLQTIMSFDMEGESK